MAINHLLYAKMLSKISYRLLWNISYWRTKPNNRGIRTLLENAVLCIQVLLTPGLQPTLVDTKKKKSKLTTIASHIFFFSKAVSVFPFFLDFSSITKFGQNFVTKKPKQKIETWRLVPTYGNKYLQNLSCKMGRQG